MRRTLALLVTASLLLPAAAVAHSGGGKLGYRSHVTAIRPPVPGLTARVLLLDDQLELADAGSATVVVLGYEGEPYLRFDRGGVWRNVNSPAYWLNLDRSGQVTPPLSASAKAQPLWRLVARTRAYHWHDHRIHWMSTILPPAIAAAPRRPRHVFDWAVPLLVGGRPATIQGSLDYVPPQAAPGSSTWQIALIAMGPAVAVGGAALVAWRRRATRR